MSLKISLVLCTVGRKKEVERFIKSLLVQTYKNYELIIIDQNRNGLIDSIVDFYKRYINIIHVKVDFKGLSKARNKGMDYVKGDIVAFPDDDCEYPFCILERVNEFFAKYSDVGVLSGMAIDKTTGKVSAGKAILKAQYMSAFKLAGVSFTMFLNLRMIDRKFIYFDEKFGIGGSFYSEEENDLVYRLLKMGYKGFYYPNKIFVFHPNKDFRFEDYNRAYKYGVGLGAFIRKNIMKREGLFFFARYLVVAPLFNLFRSSVLLNTNKIQFYFYRTKGRWEGFFKYR